MLCAPRSGLVPNYRIHVNWCSGVVLCPGAQYNALDQCEAIQAISGVASKEYSLEKVLEKMTNDWKGVEFRCIEYKDT